MMLTGDELAAELGKLLDVHPAGEDAPYLGLIDGLLTALVLSPEPVAPAEWLPALGLEDDAPFPHPGDVARFHKLLADRQYEIDDQLMRGGLAFEPIYDLGEEGEPLWQLWLVGFLQGMKLRADAWTPLFESQDENLVGALSGLIAMASTFPGLAGVMPKIEATEAETKAVAELIETAPATIPFLVDTIYFRLQGLSHEELDFMRWDEEQELGPFEPLEPIRVTKIGRNQPCPCGSGKKYKKCCGR